MSERVPIGPIFVFQEVLNLPLGTTAYIEQKSGADTVCITLPDAPAAFSVPYEWFAQPTAHVDELRAAVAEFRKGSAPRPREDAVASLLTGTGQPDPTDRVHHP